VRIDAAKAALPFEKPRLAPVAPQRPADDHVPLIERLQAYARERTIESRAGKVVPLNGTQALPRLERRDPADIDETAS
jgi:hypothetical protein